jgi:hypothetical protein
VVVDGRLPLVEDGTQDFGLGGGHDGLPREWPCTFSVVVMNKW